jgi:hypothetical protein
MKKTKMILGLFLIFFTSIVIITDTIHDDGKPEVSYETRLLSASYEEEMEEPFNENPFAIFEQIIIILIMIALIVGGLFIPYVFAFARVFVGFLFKSRLLDHPKFIFATYASWLIFGIVCYIFKDIIFPEGDMNIFALSWIIGSVSGLNVFVIARVIYVTLETGVFYMIFRNQPDLKKYMLKALPIYILFYLILWVIV